MIVSLTSFPARIPHIAPCVASLVSQIESGDRLVLWLGSEQFPHGLEDVPPQIRTFSQSEGSPLVVRFTEDIRSYKKLIPALIAFPNETIVTVDDDVVYEPHALDLLKKAHANNPKAVFAHTISDIYRSHGEWCRTSGSIGFSTSPQPLRMMVGIGGVLYPPNCLIKRITDRQCFQSFCPTNDDVWFWYCAAKAGTPILRAPGAICRPKMIAATSIGALSATNESNGDQVNRDYIRRIRDFDPAFAAVMDKTYRRHRAQIVLSRSIRALVHYPRQAVYCLRHGGFGFLKAELNRLR